MNGMPWQLSYAGSADLDNSELQTDVMRFMAILAFCLVAIFAIVQSMPLGSPTSAAPRDSATVPSVARPKPVPEPLPVVTRPEPAAAPAKPVVSQPGPGPTRPAPVARAVSGTVPESTIPTPVVQKRLDSETQRPSVAGPRPADPVPAPAARAEASPPVRQGLSLRFESDSVLRSLVERQLVGLYAIDGKNFYRMGVTAGRVLFRPGAAPVQYHEMVPDTVPREVSRTLQSQQPVSLQNIIWGVTLPAGTTHQLRRFVQTNFAGSLVINGDAQLALAGSG